RSRRDRSASSRSRVARRVRRGLVAVALAACITLAIARPGGAGPAVSSVPAGIGLHVRMEAVILSDDDGGNPAGVLTLAQLRTWIGVFNSSLRRSNAHVVIDFNPKHDLARVRNSTVNRLAHNSNGPAAQLASHYPGKMVVFF